MEAEHFFADQHVFDGNALWLYKGVGKQHNIFFVVHTIFCNLFQVCKRTFSNNITFILFMKQTNTISSLWLKILAYIENKNESRYMEFTKPHVT